MANSLCGDFEGRVDRPPYRVFDNFNYAMVARDCNRRSLRIGVWARDLSRQGRSQIGRRPLRGSQRDYHRRIDRAFHFLLGNQANMKTTPARISTG